MPNILYLLYKYFLINFLQTRPGLPKEFGRDTFQLRHSNLTSARGFHSFDSCVCCILLMCHSMACVASSCGISSSYIAKTQSIHHLSTMPLHCLKKIKLKQNFKKCGDFAVSLCNVCSQLPLYHQYRMLAFYQ